MRRNVEVLTSFFVLVDLVHEGEEMEGVDHQVRDVVECIIDILVVDIMYEIRAHSLI